MVFQELQQQAEKYLEEYDVPDSFLKEVYKKATTDKKGFESFIKTIGFGLESTYSIFIEAIWTGDDDGTEWEDFYLRELKRVVNTADAGNQDAIDELSVLIDLTDVETENKSFYTDGIDFLTSKFNSPIEKVRENCVEAIGYLMDIGTVEMPTDTILKLHKLLKEDISMKVRIECYNLLKEKNNLPKNFKWSFMDKMKIKLSGLSLD